MQFGRHFAGYLLNMQKKIEMNAIYVNGINLFSRLPTYRGAGGVLVLNRENRKSTELSLSLSLRWNLLIAFCRELFESKVEGRICILLFLIVAKPVITPIRSRGSIS